MYEHDEEMTKDQCIAEAKSQFGPSKRNKREANEEKFHGNITEITAEDFDETIETGITIVIFGMAWCPHCQNDLELMTEVQEQCKEKDVKFALVNCAKIINLELCFDQLKNGIPTTNTFIDGYVGIKDYWATTVEKYNELIAAHFEGYEAARAWKRDDKIRQRIEAKEEEGNEANDGEEIEAAENSDQDE